MLARLYTFITSLVVSKYNAPSANASPSLSTEGLLDFAPRYASSNKSNVAAAALALPAAAVALDAAAVAELPALVSDVAALVADVDAKPSLVVAVVADPEADVAELAAAVADAVSYTHLTLPTILRV